MPSEGLGDLFGRLADDGKAYARSELAYYRTLVTSRLGDAAAGLWMGALALVLINAAVIALLVGLILALSPLVGPGWATAIVVLAVVAIAGVLGLLAWSHIKRVIGSKP